MTRRILILTAAGIMMFCGCTEKKSPETGKSELPPAIPLNPGTQVAMQQPPQQPILPADPNAVMAEVNGIGITMGEINEQIRIRMTAMGRNMSPEQFQHFRPVLTLQVVDQFIAKTLLSEEAKKKNIEVTEADEKDALDKIRAGLPEGVNLEDAMAESRMGKDRLMEDLRDNIRIIKLLKPVTEQEIAVTPEEVSAFREQNKNHLRAPERIDARHILVKVEPGDDEKIRSEKKKSIEDLKKQLDEGADFAELASKHSDCGSAANGGKLPAFGRGEMIPQFEEAAFTQQEGVVGPVIETRFGYHIVKVEKHEGGSEISNEKIIELITQGKREQEITKYLDTLRKDSKIVTHPSLDEMADLARKAAEASRNPGPPMAQPRPGQNQ